MIRPVILDKLRHILPLACCLAMAFSVRAAPAADQPNIIPASDARFRYEGRFDFGDPGAPVVIWQASRITIDFDGVAAALLFADARDQSFFNAEIDGHTTIVELVAARPAVGATFANLGAGRHRLSLFKRSEASAGTVRFLGIELPPGGRAWAPAQPAYKLAMLFVGDSITAGACSEDGASDQWVDRRTHNNAVSYGAFTSAAFSADYHNYAISGMGVSTGWTSIKAGEFWDRVYPDAKSPRANLLRWIPNVVFVNLGENDDSFTRAHQQPFPAGYTDGYVALIGAIRGAYPSARIVLLRGGMFGGSQSAPLIRSWEAAVSRLEATDPLVSHFAFRHWTSNHPRASDHRAMADELVAWLRAQDFMRPYL